MNTVIEQMLAHRSIRRFTDQPVDETHIRTAIESGQMASTRWICLMPAFQKQAALSNSDAGV